MNLLLLYFTTREEFRPSVVQVDLRIPFFQKKVYIFYLPVVVVGCCVCTDAFVVVLLRSSLQITFFARDALYYYNLK